MTPRLRRAEVRATITLCSSTLVGAQSVAVQVANHQPLVLAYPKSAETIQAWVEELELDILVGFNLDPKRYKVLYHDLKPANQPCTEWKDLKSLKDKDVDNVITGPYEVHFELKENVKAPSVEELRDWQSHWQTVLTDPTQLAQKNMFTLCNSRGHLATLSLESLVVATKGDVETTLRHDLGLTTTEDVLKKQLGRALKLDLEGKEVKFHLNQEDCANLRDLSELATTTLAPNNVVKLHLPLDAQLSAGGLPFGGEISSEDEDETDEED